MIQLYAVAQKYTICLFCFILLGLPLNLHAKCQITLEWALDGAQQPEGYRLFERISGEEYYDNYYFDTGPETSCTVYDLEDNTTYHFVVRAYIAEGESEDSNEATYECTTSSSGNDPDPPTQPVTALPEDTTQDVGMNPTLVAGEFHDQDTNDYHSQSRWQIFRLDNDDCVYDVVSNTDLTSVDVPPSILEPFTAYYWTVSYYSQRGGISESAENSNFTTTQTNEENNATALFTDDNGGSSDGVFGYGCFIKSLQ